MKILKMSPYFFPEVVSASHLTDDINHALASKNIHVENFVPTPCRGLSDDVRKEYSNKLEEYLYNNMYHVTRFRVFKEGTNPIQRAIRYIYINIRQYFLGSRCEAIDVIIEGSTPPTQGLLCALVANKLSKRYGKKVPFIYHLQDIFPDSLVNTGMTKEGSLIWKIGRKIEDYTYSHADKIIVISEGFKRNIMSKGVPGEKIEVISNWVDLSAVKPVERQHNKLFDQLGINRSKFIVVYAGNIGEAQGADVIVDAAKQLSENPDIHFVIFGGGARYQDIKDRVKKEGINNIYITNLQPQERVSEVYSMGDVALITCKQGTGNAGMPSKTWSIMACNTPIIAAYDSKSDLADVIRESGAGSCVQPGDASALAKMIQTFYESRHEQKNIGYSIREYAIKKVSKEECVNQYIKTFLDTTAGTMS